MLTESVYAALSAKHADFSPSEIAAIIESDAARVDTALRQLAAENRAVALKNDCYISDTTAKRIVDTAKKIVGQFHKQNPLRRAMPIGNLRDGLAKAATIRSFDAVLNYLLAVDTLVLEGENRVKLPDFAVVLPAKWQAAAAEMLAVWQSAGLNPPYPPNFQANYPKDIHVQTILNVLTEQGELIFLEENLYISRAAFLGVWQTVQYLAHAGMPITVGTVRDAVGSSRKIITPLLEYLDRQQWTERTDDTRTLTKRHPV